MAQKGTFEVGRSSASVCDGAKVRAEEEEAREEGEEVFFRSAKEGGKKDLAERVGSTTFGTRLKAY